MNSTITHANLSQTLWPVTADNRVLRAVLLIVAGSLLLTISAKVQVPFWPVPMTMQTFVVLVLGLSLGARLAAATVAAYLVQGAIGLPVFAGGGGLAYLAGPTGGYLLGFLVAAAVMGRLAELGWDRNVVGTLGAMLLGTGIIFVLGVAWLSVLIGFQPALAAGLMPFLLGEAFKIALAAAVLPMAWRFVGSKR